jgi:hydroxyacid-oxoacid transhydrogenase
VTREQVFTLEATPLKFGRGAADEAGWDLERLGVRRAMLVSDPGVVEAGITDRVRSRVEAAGVDAEVWDRARVEPTLDSLQEAAAFAVDGGFDGFVAVGGGSSIDTAKAADLIASCGGELMAYVNPPVGEGRAPPERLRPLLAIPTTCGSGAEATSVAVLDVPELRVKTGISHRYLRPDQAIVDPSLTSSLPGEVVASCGLDVICHAAESFISKPYTERDAPDSPGDRPPYQGATPISDIWSAKALEYGGRCLRAAVAGDGEARGAMMLAATLAGVGFGSAGVHIPHACAYPVAGLRPRFRPPGYPADHEFVPHGLSVIVTAPAAFAFTAPADPERHAQVARLLGRDDGDLPAALRALMRDVGAPAGLRALGYGEGDVPALVEGALRQQRLLAVAPREPGADDLAAILTASL